jgi:hypothetical protein
MLPQLQSLPEIQVKSTILLVQTLLEGKIGLAFDDNDEFNFLQMLW